MSIKKDRISSDLQPDYEISRLCTPYQRNARPYTHPRKLPSKIPPLRSDKNHQTGNIKKHQIIWNNPIMERMGRRICKLFMQLSGGRNNKKLHHKSEKTSFNHWVC